MASNLSLWTSILTGSVAALGSGLWYMGAFRKITFQKSTLGPFMFVYQVHIGPYSQVGSYFERAVAFLSKYQLDGCATLAGLYHDDPKTNDGETLRASVGFLLNGNDEYALEKWNNISADGDDHEEGNAKGDWSVIQIKKTDTLMSSFPMRQRVLSCVLSAMKTYPAFEKSGLEQLKCGAAPMEIYLDDEIMTHFPQNNHEQFQCSVKASVKASHFKVE